MIVPAPGVGTGPGFSGFGATGFRFFRWYLAVFVLAKYSQSGKIISHSQAVGDDTRIKNPRGIGISLP